MKKYIIFSLLAVVFTFGFTPEANAQRGKKKSSKTDEYFDESGNWTRNLWYGAGGVLNFGSARNYNIFRIGLSPMVGYKVTPWLSAGPRFSFIYNSSKGGVVDVRRETLDPIGGTQQIGVFKVNSVDVGVGAFARAKFLRSFFVHTEIESLTQKFYDRAFDGNGNLYYLRYSDNFEYVTFKENNLNGYIGGGYNSGNGQLGYEIMFLFNVLLPDNSLRQPFEFRAGLTYNF